MYSLVIGVEYEKRGNFPQVSCFGGVRLVWHIHTKHTNISYMDGNNFRLRIVYFGPDARATYQATKPIHDARQQNSVWCDSMETLRQSPTPDVVVHAPLWRPGSGPGDSLDVERLEVAGTCALSAAMPASTLLVAVFGSTQSAHQAVAGHAWAETCHPRLLLCARGDHAEPEDLVDEIDLYLEEGFGLREVQVNKGFLDCDFPRVDRLGPVLASERLGGLLYGAALNPDIGSWQELGETICRNPGTLQNQRRDLGELLKLQGLYPHDKNFTKESLIVLASKYQSFILAYCQAHTDWCWH